MVRDGKPLVAEFRASGLIAPNYFRYGVYLFGRSWIFMLFTSSTHYLGLLFVWVDANDVFVYPL